jgi:hypothetical protein
MTVPSYSFSLETQLHLGYRLISVIVNNRQISSLAHTKPWLDQKAESKKALQTGGFCHPER